MSRTIQSPVNKQIGVAVITRQGKILIDKRKAGGEMGGFWEFPGGKIEAGETVKECIKREIKEELNLEIDVNGLLTTIHHAYQTFSVTLYVHDCQYLGGEAQTLECEQILWVNPSEIDQYQFPPANIQIIKLLQQRGINK